MIAPSSVTRFAVSSALAALLSLVLTGAAAGSSVQSDAPMDEVMSVPCMWLYEHSNHGEDRWKLCYPDNINNMADLWPGITGCYGGFFEYTDMNDCISSFKVFNAGCNYGVNLYVDSGYVNRMPGPYSGWGSRSIANMGAYNDSLSSIKWLYRSQCPL